MKFFTKPPLGTPLNPAHPLNRGLVGYWALGEGAGSKTQDLSGNGNHGTLTNMVQGATSGWTGGKFGGAINFDGVDDFINTSDISAFDSLPACSVSIWVKLNTLSVMQTPMGKYVGPVGLLFQTGTGGLGDGDDIIFGFNDGHFVYTTANVLKLNVWQLWVGTFDTGLGTNKHLIYVDGLSRVLSNNGSPDNITSTGASTGLFHIGKNNAINRFVNGSLSEARIYNRALSASEVRQLYTDPFCMYEQKSIFRWFTDSIKKGSFFFSK